MEETSPKGSNSMESANIYHILCIEGNADNLELFVKFLELDGYQVTPANSFGKALDLALKYSFDLCLVGDGFVDGTSLDLVGQIHAFEPQIPIVCCSARAFSSDIERGLKAGAQAYLTKPFDPVRFQEVIKRLIRQSYYESLEAKRVEVRAIREELARRRQETAEAIDHSRKLFTKAEEELLRIKALTAFLAARGTSANFRRLWPEVLTAELEHLGVLRDVR